MDSTFLTVVIFVVIGLVIWLIILSHSLSNTNSQLDWAYKRINRLEDRERALLEFLKLETRTTPAKFTGGRVEVLRIKKPKTEPAVVRTSGGY